MPSLSAVYQFFATVPKGISALLAAELGDLGAQEVRLRPAGASFSGSLELGYRVCLWSRLASRVLLHLIDFPAPTPEALYKGVGLVNWEEHLDREGTLAVDCRVSPPEQIHSHYAALKIKDAVVDQFRQRHGVRPSVNLERPQVRLSAYLYHGTASLYLDLAGESLHRRGYRQEGGEAPLKENLAAALLARAGWPQVAREGGSLLDPMCGSGTLPIEAALMAADRAPALARAYFGFVGWKGHCPELWQALLSQAQRRWEAGKKQVPLLVGSDADPQAVEAARANVRRAGLEGVIHIERRALAQAQPPGKKGLLVVNPPYGERLGQDGALRTLYEELGRVLRERFRGWKAVVFTGNPSLGKHLGMRAVLINKFYNGPIECRLLRLEVEERFFHKDSLVQRSAVSISRSLSPGAQMLANRLRKNRRLLGRWARREGISCFRLYDADLPEYALAVDLYEGEKLWVHAQEYQAPASISEDRARARLQEALAVLLQVLEIPSEQLFLKVRRRQKGRGQYQKAGDQGQFHQVCEGPCRFLVNFTDYLDTGLFLDHRPTRALIGELAKGRRFLNLFAYTGTATVRAALGGALSTTSVDVSPTYLDWARRNLLLNGLERPAHELVRADCLEWLGQRRKERYGLIFVDPPTFSNSRHRQHPFEVQRDHPELIHRATALLEENGILIFSNNYRRFKMNWAALEGLAVEEITPQTLPRDFQRRPRIHNCWKIQSAQALVRT
jgi:23S rRNA (guanine2445-N2)-methyltransferase / 23S rRNA (guanine2069-N7)-methyltransferase